MLVGSCISLILHVNFLYCHFCPCICPLDRTLVGAGRAGRMDCVQTNWPTMSSASVCDCLFASSTIWIRNDTVENRITFFLRGSNRESHLLNCNHCACLECLYYIAKIHAICTSDIFER